MPQPCAQLATHPGQVTQVRSRRSGLPLSHTKEDKGTFGDVAHERSQWEAATEQEMSQGEQAVGGQQESGWAEDGRSQEPSLQSVPEDSQGEDVPELSQREAERDQELSPGEEDLHSHLSPWEHRREPELSPARDSSDEALFLGAEAVAQELSQWEEDVTSSTGDKTSSPASEEEPQPCSSAGPSSSSPVGTALAPEAAPGLPSTSHALGSPLEPEPAAAGAAGQEEPPKPVTAQQEEKAAEPPVPSQELPPAGTQSQVSAPQSPQGRSQALLDLARHLSCEIVRRALLEVQASGRQPQGPLEPEQRVHVEMVEAATWPGEPRPGPALQSLLGPSSARLRAFFEQQLVGPVAWSVGAERGSDEDTSDWDIPWDSSSDPDMSQGEYDSETELSPEVDHEVRELTPWEENISSRAGDKRLSPVEEEKPQPCSSDGPDSSSAVGTAVAPEAAPALPSTSPAPQRPTEAEPAAAAPAGAAGLEEPPEPVAAQEEEKAEESPVPSEELLSMGTQSSPSVPYNTQDSSSALLCREQSSSGQLLSQAQLQHLEQRDALEEAAGAAPALRQQSPVPGKSHMEEELYQQEGVQEAELSLGERNNSQGGSQWGECAEQELSQEVSYWEEHAMEEMSHGNINSWKEVSNWEEHIGQGLSQEEVSLGQDMSQRNRHSSWEGDSNPEQAQNPWKVGSHSGVCMKPLARGEDTWGEVSILELPPEEGREQKWRAFAADRLPVPLPHETWSEEQAPQPCSSGLLCASHVPMEGQAPMGHVASPTEAFHGQLCAKRRRPSRFRRALQALQGRLCCPCLAAPPEEQQGHGADSSHCSRAVPPTGLWHPRGSERRQTGTNRNGNRSVEKTEMAQR